MVASADGRPISRTVGKTGVPSIVAGRVSSPASTGGAGTFFEQHVDAYWLAQLLVRGIPPIISDCTVAEVHFQTEHFGWHTDDFLVVGQDGSERSRQLAGQVKRTLTVSAADEECRKAVQDAWKDFSVLGPFSPATDRFAFVTLRGTNALLEHFSALLDCARAARDRAEFEHRLSVSGFINAKAIHYCDAIREIVGETEGRDVSIAEIWPFLRVLHVLSLDLNSTTRQTEALIKTLLAHTASEQDGMAVAEASWNALLREVGEGMPEARSYRRDDLPVTLQRLHSPLGAGHQRVLQALSDHSALILDSIRSTVGGILHLERSRLVQQVLEQLQHAQIVLISGAAGSGKSVIAKDAIEFLEADHFAFSFRAEEFAQPHFDATLQSNQIPASAAMLGVILAGQGRKVLLVESIERLLEKSTRDAFTDLLTLVAAEQSWRLVVTCRAYSADLIRACFLEPANASHSVVTVPPLNDEELGEAGTVHPVLVRPLANAALRRLLRNPYFLDKALQIQWSEEKPLPQSEWELRSLFWQEIVRADHRTAAGMPRRREDVFVEIALRRARALALYANCSGLDLAVIEDLRRDSLVVPSQQSDTLVAPAHDVLEDWAILRWIEEQHVIHAGSVRTLSEAIGTHPAVRRSYRKWVAELAERECGAADELFEAAVGQTGLAAQFRDDTMASLLRSPSSVEFLERHRAELFANSKRLLLRVIHLLRVACVTTPDWLETSMGSGSLVNVPDGAAWAGVLRMVRMHLECFGEEDHALLLGFIEDWARGVSLRTPYPEGAESVATIAHHVLRGLDDYRSRDQRGRVLRVIAKIPNGDRERFAALLRGGQDSEEQNHAAEDFHRMLFGGLEGTAAGRDMPEEVIASATNCLLCSENDLCSELAYTGDPELELLFGVKRGSTRGFFPASAYRGPFLSLLRHHPRQGLAFIIDVFNHSADWYAHPRVRSRGVGLPFEITLTFSDGSTRTQWCNSRLWNLYRGTSVGPDILQSLLMALERWLLEWGEVYPRLLDGILLRILRQSDSAALTAVVASVATAFPHACGEALLVLLQSPLCIQLDRQRRVNEFQAPSTVLDVLPQLGAANRVYTDERKDADSLHHRHYDLGTAITSLQLGPLAPQVQEILDRYRAQMPPLDEQTREDRRWRLTLHHMDLRQYTIGDNGAEVSAVGEDDADPEDAQQYIRLSPKELEPDLKEVVNRNAVQAQSANAKRGLLMWGLKAFRREDDATYDSVQWRQKLQEARQAHVGNGDGEEYDLCSNAPGFLAAVSVRDHWQEMSRDEQVWCIGVMCSEVERDGDRWSRLARQQRDDMSADRPCAQTLPALLGKSLPQDQRAHVRQVFVVALTHAINEVRWYAASGIGMYLWTIDRGQVLRCVNALATESMLVQQALDAQSARPLPEHRQLDDIEAEAARLVRRMLLEDAASIANDAYAAMDPATSLGAKANGPILAILGQAPTESIAVWSFERLAHTFAEWWDADDDRRDRHQRRHGRSSRAEQALTDLLANFLLRAGAADAIAVLQPIVNAIDRHPDKVHWLLLLLIGIEDRRPNTLQFWTLWEQFADGVRRAMWLERIDDEYASGSEMISAIFLGTWWKDGIHHWQSLEGHARRVHELFEDLPASSTVLDCYLRFLCHVGEQSLPEAFTCVARRLRQGHPTQMLRKSNTVFLLEVLLQRYVYGRPLELKQRSGLREDVLLLLDRLVENGSSAAFRMRDDFVTPVSIG